jgi:hypothetical protein
MPFYNTAVVFKMNEEEVAVATFRRSDDPPYSVESFLSV